MALPLRSSVRAGEWLALSGQLGIIGGVLSDGFEAQATQALANFCAELQMNGLSPRDVVKTTVFITDPADYAGLNAAYSSVFTDEPPARSVIIVRALPLGALFEIEGWAHAAQE
jgi:2-iminobutanoate/2-iminopropanoate deaminase